jgi:DNA-binding HxlR family transcriptional regulator
LVRYKCKDYACTVEMSFDLLGGKWKAPAIYWLAEGTLRFRDLERRLPRTSRKVLVQQLRDLEADGIVSRKVYAQVPPRVEYTLTERGRKLIPIIRSLDAWATEILDDEAKLPAAAPEGEPASTPPDAERVS